jgi:hypothetical protein
MVFDISQFESARDKYQRELPTYGETLVRITSPHFCAGLIFTHDPNGYNVCAPILHYMRDWSSHKIITYCLNKEWKLQYRPPDGDKEWKNIEGPI